MISKLRFESITRNLWLNKSAKHIFFTSSDFALFEKLFSIDRLMLFFFFRPQIDSIGLFELDFIIATTNKRKKITKNHSTKHFYLYIECQLQKICQYLNGQRSLWYLLGKNGIYIWNLFSTMYYKTWHFPTNCFSIYSVFEKIFNRYCT